MGLNIKERYSTIITISTAIAITTIASAILALLQPLSCHSIHVHIHNLHNHILHSHILHSHILWRDILVPHQLQLQHQLLSCHSIHVHSHIHHNLHNHILHIHILLRDILVQHQLQQIAFHNIHIHHILHTLHNHIHHNHHGGSQPLLKHRQLQGAQLQALCSSSQEYYCTPH